MTELRSVTREITASVTERGQVTIPAEVRRVLGLKPRDKVDFVVEGETVSLKKPAFTVETAYGSVPPLKKARSWKKVREVVADDRAAAYEEKLKRSEG